MKTLVIGIILLITVPAFGQEENLEVLISGRSNPYNWLQMTDKENVLIHHLTDQAMFLLSEREKEISKFQTKEEWESRKEKIRETLIDIIGPLPEKTPLNAKIIKAVNKNEYKVEHIIFESQPGFYVTSSLYIPGISHATKTPAILYCSGHTREGYRSSTYQNKIINLVKKGFIVFAFDPVGQGERIEYYDQDTGRSTIGGPTSEHSYSGAQVFITGSSYAKYLIWDGIRAVDYLLSRKEVDPKRIGITGRSGGGTQSAYIAAMDERIYAAAPEAYITSFKRLLQSSGPQDAEQNMYHGILRGIEHGDFITARAPKPALIIGTTRDFFSIQGFLETGEKLTRVYKAYDKEDHFSISVDDGRHESTRKNREAMYAFFQNVLDNPGDSREVETTLLSEEELQVTQTGQVSTSLKGESTFSLNQKEAKKLIGQLNTSRKDLSNHLPKVLKSAKKLSGYKEPSDNFDAVFTGRYQREGYTIEKYFIPGEGNYVIPYLLFKPAEPGSKALIYLHPEGKSIDAAPGGEIEQFAKKGFTVLVPDLPGIGEMGPGIFRGDSHIEGTSYNLWFASVLIGRSITGIRAGDVVRLTRLLNNQEEFSDIYALAKRELSPVLIHAAAFEPSISRVVLLEPYSSYRSIVMNRFYNPDFIHGTVPGALREYDLPDIAANIAPRELAMINVTDGAGRTGGHDDHNGIQADLAVMQSSYQWHNTESSLEIITLSDIQEYFSNWTSY